MRSRKILISMNVEGGHSLIIQTAVDCDHLLTQIKSGHWFAWKFCQNKQIISIKPSINMKQKMRIKPG